VIGPADNVFGGTIKEISQSFSDIDNITEKDEAIDSLSDLDGMIVAITDQHVPGACLAKKIVDEEGLNVSEVNESSNDAQLDAVAAGRADATVLWESMFESYANSTNPKIKVNDLEDYRMDNYIAILNKSDNLAEAEMYVKYLLAALAINSSGNKINRLMHDLMNNRSCILSLILFSGWM